MARQVKNMIQLGVFVTVGTLLFIASVYYLGNAKNLFGNTISVYTDFHNVKGLQAGNLVRYSGINVGSIKDVLILNDSTLRVEMMIKNEVKDFIKKNAVASIGTDGLVGSALVNITPKGNKFPSIEDGDIIKSHSKFETDEVLESLGNMSENIAMLSVNLVEITGKINKGDGVFGALINDENLVDDMNKSIRNIKNTGRNLVTMSDELNETISKIQDGEGLLGYLLTDTILALRMEGIASNVDTVIMRVDTVMDKQVNPIFADLKTSMEELSSFSEEMKKVAEDINAGKGAVGSLLKDEATDQQVQEILTNMNESSAKLNENMEALRSNWFFRKFFKKKAKKEKKAKEKAEKEKKRLEAEAKKKSNLSASR